MRAIGHLICVLMTVCVIVVPAGSRFTLALSDVLRGIVPDQARADIGIRVTASSPEAQLYAEQAVYGTPPGGARWSRGAAHRGDGRK